MKNKKLIVIISVLLVISLGIIITLTKGNTGDKKSYSVRFYDHQKTVIWMEEVAFGKNATSPFYKIDSNHLLFMGWDKDFNNVKEDLDIYPIVEDITNKKNVIYSSSSILNNNNEIEVSIQIIGNVNFACMELVIEFDDKYLEYVGTASIDGDGLVNVIDNKMYYVFACGKNITSNVDLITLKFKVVKNTTLKNLINIQVNDIASFSGENDFLDEEYTVLIQDIIINNKK